MTYFDNISVFPFPICHSVNKLKGKVYFKVYVYKYVCIHIMYIKVYAQVHIYKRISIYKKEVFSFFCNAKT